MFRRLYCFFCPQSQVVFSKEEQSLLPCSPDETNEHNDLAENVHKEVLKFLSECKSGKYYELTHIPVKKTLPDLCEDFRKRNQDYLRLKKAHSQNPGDKTLAKQYVEASHEAYTAFNVMRSSFAALSEEAINQQAIKI